MIPTLTAFVALLLFVLPGLVLVQLQEAQRARRSWIPFMREWVRRLNT